MFSSIQYKLYLYTVLLIISTAVLTYSIIYKEYLWATISAILIITCLVLINQSYKKYNQNFNFLINALDNGDYSFHFSETKLSKREQELNVMLNWIKEILGNARKEVIENEKFLSLIMESVSTGIVIIDDRGIVHTVNQAALDMFGLPVFTHVNQLQNVNETFPRVFHGLKAGDSTQITMANEREELQISLKVSEIKMKRGIMRVIALNNIGNELESKEMESWIRLIRVMTHEIMNSIAPITSLSETMQSILTSEDTEMNNDSLKQDTLEAFETINSTAAGLLTFVESYRKFTSVPQPKKKDFSVSHLIEKVINLHRNSIDEKGIEIITDTSGSGLIINADENLINQVLINLVKNAIEAVEPDTDNKNKIIISASRQPGNGLITINVANTGKPIPPDILAHIFIPFFTTKTTGSGIGLSVSRYIMRLHGGKLQHLLSPEGMTVFSMTFLP